MGHELVGVPFVAMCTVLATIVGGLWWLSQWLKTVKPTTPRRRVRR